jgi:hypothetical protein
MIAPQLSQTSDTLINRSPSVPAARTPTSLSKKNPAKGRGQPDLEDSSSLMVNLSVCRMRPARARANPILETDAIDPKATLHSSSTRWANRKYGLYPAGVISCRGLEAAPERKLPSYPFGRTSSHSAIGKRAHSKTDILFRSFTASNRSSHDRAVSNARSDGLF